MAFANRDAALPVAAINITPLVDVLLVLLVIFMVTAPVLARSLDVRLPQSVDQEQKPAPQLHLRVDAAGGYWLEDAAVDRGALVGTLRAATGRLALRLAKAMAFPSSRGDFRDLGLRPAPSRRREFAAKKKAALAGGSKSEEGKRRGALQCASIGYSLTKPIFCICALRAVASTLARMP